MTGAARGIVSQTLSGSHRRAIFSALVNAVWFPTDAVLAWYFVAAAVAASRSWGLSGGPCVRKAWCTAMAVSSINAACQAWGEAHL
jgi:hypothetical protein